ncbi:MAG: ROK family transcriptional regulator [Anaerolineaceae bacterium]|nr:ROK family transcriptional regulator [Anaerolineaceae bacterium]
MKYSFNRTINQSEMRAINRSAILEYFRLNGLASRTEIAHQLDLSLPTVKRIIDQLLEENLVRTSGKKESGRGRRRELLELNFKENAVISVDLGGLHMMGAIINIGGEILYSESTSEEGNSADQNCEKLIDLIKSLLEIAENRCIHIMGCAIGVPGIVQRESGLIQIAPGLSWKEYPLMHKLKQQLDIPILLENDVNMAALGEYWFGGGRGKQHMVFVAVGSGIGSGVIINGSLYYGHTESAGEIGYILPGIEFLDREFKGYGAIELLASGKGIAAMGKAVLIHSGRPELAAKVTAEQIFEAARNNEDWASEIVKKVIDYLSLLIANVSSCFDPELIVLGGGILRSSDLLIEPICERVQRVIPNVPEIAATKLDDRAALYGGVVVVFQAAANYAFVSSLN